jgi:hypothetical protein
VQIISTGLGISTSHPLFGASLRWERADKHLTEAHLLLVEFARGCEQHIVAEYDIKTDQNKILLPDLPPIPILLPLAISDAIHNLRAALDYLVYELAINDSGHIQEGTQFLIEDCKADPADRSRGFDQRSKTYLRGLSVAHISAIERRQPYNGVAWTKTLREISNPDKHRKLIPMDTQGSAWIVVHGPGSYRGRNAYGGRTLPSGHIVNVEPDHAVRVVLPDGPVPLMPTLRSLRLEIGQVIESFGPEF